MSFTFTVCQDSSSPFGLHMESVPRSIKSTKTDKKSLAFVLLLNSLYQEGCFLGRLGNDIRIDQRLALLAARHLNSQKCAPLYS